MNLKRARGATIVEACIVIFVVGLVVAAAITSIHGITTGIQKSDTGVADVVHFVTQRMRTMGYDLPSPAASASWTVDSQTFATGCTSALATCVGVTTTAVGPNLKIVANHLHTGETQTAQVPLVTEASDPNATVTPGP